jgi:hypothetical protein
MRVTAAPTPIKTAKMGSATREMMYVGAGMLRIDLSASDEEEVLRRKTVRQ